MKRKIRFARLSFERKLSHYQDHQDAEERRRDALLEVIDFETNVNELLRGTDQQSKRKLGQWYFGDVDEEDNVISARIGKEKEETSRLVDEEKQGFVEVDHEDTDVAFFIIDLSVSVMAYESRRDVGEKAPYRILEAAFNSYHEGTEELSISPIVDKEEIRNELQRISRVTRIEFRGLSPSNPDRTELSEPMDEFLKEGGIDKLFFDGRSDFDESSTGINMEIPLLNGGLSLAEDGYGSASIKGKMKSGEEVQVTTEEKQVESELEEANTDRMYRKRLIDEIVQTLDELED